MFVFSERRTARPWLAPEPREEIEWGVRSSDREGWKGTCEISSVKDFWPRSTYAACTKGTYGSLYPCFFLSNELYLKPQSIRSGSKKKAYEKKVRIPISRRGSTHLHIISFRSQSVDFWNASHRDDRSFQLEPSVKHPCLLVPPFTLSGASKS